MEINIERHDYRYERDLGQFLPTGFLALIAEAGEALAGLDARLTQMQENAADGPFKYISGVSPFGIVIEWEGDPVGMVQFLDEEIQYVPFKATPIPAPGEGGETRVNVHHPDYLRGVVDLEGGETLINVHRPDVCDGRPCPIHNMSDHSMRSFPQHWRGDWGIIERICPHGIGHPDPDDIAGRVARGLETDTVHGCDGCCSRAYRVEESE